MVIPATLSATIGLDQIRTWLARLVPGKIISAAVAIGLAAATLFMTRDAVVNGPLWFPKYGLHGLQWGAKELFGDLQRRLASASPQDKIVVSHKWANNTNALGEFFFSPAELGKIRWAILEDILRQRFIDVLPTTAFVLTPDEFSQAQQSEKLQVDPDHSVVSTPDGRPGFYIVRLAYTPEADALFAAEREERRRLIDNEVDIAGGTARIRHPKLDQGKISNAFDGDFITLARTLDANPTDLEISFSNARPVSGLRLHLWVDFYNITLRATRRDGERATVRAQHITRIEGESFEIHFDEVIQDVVRLDLHIAKRGDVHIHLREIEILP